MALEGMDHELLNHLHLQRHLGEPRGALELWRAVHWHAGRMLKRETKALTG